MLRFLCVAIGSAIGGLARYGLGTLVQRRFNGVVPRGAFPPYMPLPVGTLVVNVTGSFLIGVLLVAIGRETHQSHFVYLLLVVGVCGGYTTFSAFSADSVLLVESGALGIAALNVALSFALAFAGTFAGLYLTRMVLGRGV
ncbi:MAG: crcB [Gemmatimonadetes bacterium]|nr:crcB [Gemmatimonadota bacterium]